ncbi:MAG: hypothetical protein M3162_08825 [Thermoproteota archaeon]|nr:hypothetical protein [Thermoproteota archaeon]
MVKSINEIISLPLLLAGPIIRRAEPKRVCIWIATSKPVYSRVKIFRLDLKCRGSNGDSKINGIQSQIIGYGITSPIRLGDNLFISVITAKPINTVCQSNGHNIYNQLAFPSDELLAYDIELYDKNDYSGKGIRLDDLGLLSGKNSILYDDRSNAFNCTCPSIIPLPTFFLAGKKYKSSLNILFGSCRKLHGEGEDTLVVGDRLISSTVTDLKNRPSALFLTGDQIYADDVAGPLINYISKLAFELLGWAEEINGMNKKLTDINNGNRKQIVKINAKLTSPHSGNHLIGIGEFAAMYLLAWNPLNWPNLDNLLKKRYPKNSDFGRQIQSLKKSHENIYAVRRLFANIPTYMMCDDHDITDDWNINGTWNESVRNSICGRQLVANGLVAFWAFQAWGNDPDLYNEKTKEIIITYLDKRKKYSEYMEDKTSYDLGISIGNDHGRSLLTDLELLEEYIWNSFRWTFLAPTKPVTIFIDSRTQRDFVTTIGPPRLLNDEALSFVKYIISKSFYKPGDPLMVVSPPPIFGFELAEGIQRFLTSLSGTYKWDYETWRANEDGFIKFMFFLIKNFHPEYCIFMSGDVHYGFTMKGEFTVNPKKIKNSENGMGVNKGCESLSIVQLTSSPLKSSSLKKRIIVEYILNFMHKIFFRRPMRRTGHYNYENIPINNHTAKGNNYDHQGEFIEWKELRTVVKTQGSGGWPILARNNIGLLCLNSDSRLLLHKLFFIEKDKIRYSEARVSLE